MFERPQSGENTLLVQVSLEFQLTDADIQEFRELALSAGATILADEKVSRRYADPKYLIGRGKVDELVEVINACDVHLVIFNALLSPSQERNLEKLFQCRVLDRTGLILDIFAQRAKSHEGKLQVELAQLKHLSTRLIRGWTHLERQKGGIGLRGPGESQLETDRRLIGERIKQISRRLDKVSSQRELIRTGRRRKGFPVVAVVGYTNAGKSTLFNELTDAKSYAQDQLFATLDTMLRKLKIDSAETVLLADTVGFVSHLPHELVAAFKATLQETVDADLLLHVIDSADPSHLERERDVLEILASIGASDIPVIRVYNKIDLTGQHPKIVKHDEQVFSAYVSSLKQVGLNELAQAIIEFFYGSTLEVKLNVPATENAFISMLYREQVIKVKDYDEKGFAQLTLSLTESQWKRIQKTFPDTIECL